jgi:hypothetical protein
MFRLVTFFASACGLLAFVWFGLTVDLGDRTLFGHLRAIGGSQEAQDLWSGTKGKVTDFVGIEAAKRAEAAARQAQAQQPRVPQPAAAKPAPAKPAPPRLADTKKKPAPTKPVPPPHGAATRGLAQVEKPGQKSPR